MRRKAAGSTTADLAHPVIIAQDRVVDDENPKHSSKTEKNDPATSRRRSSVRPTRPNHHPYNNNPSPWNSFYARFWKSFGWGAEHHRLQLPPPPQPLHSSTSRGRHGPRLLLSHHHHRPDSTNNTRLLLYYSYYPLWVLSCLAVLVIATVAIHHAYHHHSAAMSIQQQRRRLPPRQIRLPDVSPLPRDLLRNLRRNRPPHSSSASSGWDEQTQQAREPPVILFPDLGKGPNYLGTGIFHPPWPQDDDDFVEMQREEDYGDLEGLRFMVEDGRSRVLYRTEWERRGYRSPPSSSSDSRSPFYDQTFAFDDDVERSPYQDFDDDKILKESQCRRPSWYRFQAPVCNILHELDVATTLDKFVGEGGFREVFEVHNNYLSVSEAVAFKESKFERDLDLLDMENIRLDALVAEKFSAHPKFVDMWAYCGFSTVTELFHLGDIEDDFVPYQKRDENFRPTRERILKPRNKFEPSDKLHLALEMVEPLVAMHEQWIVHDDVDLGQYLWADASKRTIKLNDFNRAEIMLWDEKNLEYCSYTNGKGRGTWRSPEEYLDHRLSPKIDVWSVGHNMYSLLTGLYPYFNIEETEDIQDAVMEAERPIIDPRYRTNSFAESKLVEIIQKCHTYDPDLRPDMAEIQKMLKEAIEEDQRLQDEAAANENAESISDIDDEAIEEDLRLQDEAVTNEDAESISDADDEATEEDQRLQDEAAANENAESISDIDAEAIDEDHRLQDETTTNEKSESISDDEAIEEDQRLQDEVTTNDNAESISDDEAIEEDQRLQDEAATNEHAESISDAVPATS